MARHYGQLGGVVLHERVVREMINHSLSGFIPHELEIVEIQNKQLEKLETPKYFILEVTGKFDVDWNEIDDIGGSICPVCFHRNTVPGNPYNFSPKRRVPIFEGLNEGDILKTRNLQEGHFYCSKRFVDLACKNKWTNFIFGESLPGVTMVQKPSKSGISYWDLDWFEKLSQKVKSKNPDLFGLPVELPNPVTPSAQVTSIEQKPQDAPAVELSYEEQLVAPQWDVVEKAMGTPMPNLLKEFYADPVKVLEMDFMLKAKEKIEEKYEIEVAKFRPIDESAIHEFDDGEKMLRIADDGGEGDYLINPTESDPEVIMLYDYTEYNETGLKLSEFLSGPRLNQEE